MHKTAVHTQKEYGCDTVVVILQDAGLDLAPLSHVSLTEPNDSTVGTKKEGSNTIVHANNPQRSNDLIQATE